MKAEEINKKIIEAFAPSMAYVFTKNFNTGRMTPEERLAEEKEHTKRAHALLATWDFEDTSS